MEFTEKDGFLIVKIALNDVGVLSSTGKTESYATTHGNVSTGIMRDGKPLMVGLNAFTSIPKHLRKPVVAAS
jgi:hypothetical protein